MGGFSGITTDFERNGRLGISNAFRVLFRNYGGEHQRAGKKGTSPRCFEGFEKPLCRFDMQAIRAAFPDTIVINVTGGQVFGKNNRKSYADRQGEQQHFPFATLHGCIIAGLQAGVNYHDQDNSLSSVERIGLSCRFGYLECMI